MLVTIGAFRKGYSNFRLAARLKWRTFHRTPANDGPTQVHFSHDGSLRKQPKFREVAT